jgi:hypothetical protein
MAVLDEEQTYTSLNSVRGDQSYLDTENYSVHNVRKLPHGVVPVGDQLLQGFLPAARCHIERKQLGLRLRARLVAVQIALTGERRSTLPEIAEQVGTSTRTLNLQFGVRDALFAFPPPELVPVLFDCWVSAEDSSGLNNGLACAFRELDRNPLARSLLMGLAHLHTDQPKLLLTDGYFNAALRSQLSTHEAVSTKCLGWTGYITDALRDSFQEWASGMPGSLESIVPRLMERLSPIPFLSERIDAQIAARPEARSLCHKLC